MADDVDVELSRDECWQLLREHEFGRLAFTVVDEQHLTPINYAVDGETLLFRTAPGSKLLAVALGAEVAFEIDDFAGETAVSVVVRGRARHLPEDEAHRAENVPAAAVGRPGEVRRRRDRARGGHRPPVRARPALAAPAA